MPDKKQNTPLAIALSYDKDAEPAPHVVATGKGYIAEQIIALAKQSGVAVHHDAELATILSVLKVDTIIPVEAYAAVAEILSYVYRTNARYRNDVTAKGEPNK